MRLMRLVRRGDFYGGILRQRTIVILQNAQRGADHVIELTAVGHTEESPDCDEHNHDAERNEVVERFHDVAFQLACGNGDDRIDSLADDAVAVPARRKRSAFSTTIAELTDMPMPDNQGLRRPNAAAGMAIAL